VYVTAPNCHFCEEGTAVVQRLAAETGLPLERADWHSAQAMELAEHEQPLFPPALYLGQRLLGYGRLSERRLRKLLRTVAA
jgi:hypothetical protein